MPEPSPLSLIHTAVGGDVIGRDKIVNNIQHIYQRALTVIETAAQERSLETQALAQGVSAIAARLQAVASETSDTEGRDANPYKGLLSYRLSDAEIFFGRSQAIAGVLGRLQRGRLTVLHSESGAGKSSLMQAGIAPRLIGAGHLPLYLRPYNNYPGFVIKRAFISDLGQTPILSSAPLREFLRQVCNVLGPQTTLYIFLDQFEEFFTQLNAPAREDFANELAECLDDEGLNVRWMFSLRTEFFGNLATLRPQISNPFENDFRLNRLTHAEAHEVITEPVKRRGITFEAGLIETILNDLGNDQVSPPETQLVCSALYADLRPGQTVITRERYNALGGAPGILSDHLERVLGRDLPAAQRPIARRILESLITSDGRRILRARDALAAEVLAAFPDPVPPETLDAVLSQLSDSRLLRPQEQEIETPDGALTRVLAYELAHDYLLDKIKLDPAAQARKAAQELLEQELRAYERYGSVLSAEKLAIIEARRDELAVSDAARKLIDLSEQRLKRRQRIIVGSASVVVLLLIVGVVAGMVALGATDQLGKAERALSDSLTQQVVAVDAQQAAQTAAVSAATREAQAQAAVVAAQTQQAVSEAQSVAAATNVASANTVLVDLFRKDGVVTVGHNPQGLVFDGQSIWVANINDGTVQAVDSQTGLAAAPIAVGGAPIALAFDGQLIWVVNFAGMVQTIDPKTNQVVGEPIPVGQEPRALAFDGRQMWIANAADGTVQAIEVSTRSLSGDPIEVGSQPAALAFGWTRVWVANFGDDTVQAVDPVTHRAVGDPITVGAGPSALAFAGSQLWVVNSTANGVQAIDPATNQVKAMIPVGVGPNGLLYDGERLWVVIGSDDTISIIDPVTNSLTGHVRVGRGPVALAFDGAKIWVSNASDSTLESINPATRDLQAPVPVTGGPGPLAFDGKYLWVASYLTSVVQIVDPEKNRPVGQPIQVGQQPSFLAYDGRRVWVVSRGAGTLQSIDPATNQTSLPISVGESPFGLFFDGRRLWISNELDDTIRAIDPNTGREIRLVEEVYSPSFLFSDGVRLWAASPLGLYPINPEIGKAEQPIDTGGSGSLQGIAFDGQWVWVVVDVEKKVKAFDPITRAPGPVVEVGNTPTDLIFDGDRLWVANTGDGSIQAIDPATGTADLPIRVGDGPLRLAFDGKRIWVSNYRDDSVRAIVVKR